MNKKGINEKTWETEWELMVRSCGRGRSTVVSPGDMFYLFSKHIHELERSKQ